MARTRRTFKLLWVMATLLFAVSALLWVRTFFATDAWTLGRFDASGLHYRNVHVRWAGDFVSASVQTGDVPPHLSHLAKRWHFVHESGSPDRQGFDSWLWRDHYVDHQPAGRTEVWRVQVRPWLVALVLSIVPAYGWFVVARRTRRAARLGLCPACGYDLRATPGRCPECGTEPEPIRRPLIAPRDADVSAASSHANAARNARARPGTTPGTTPGATAGARRAP